ncbi:Uu.00g004610.m01.CDS01 [Anthostomella pinea]|uniref:Uu.00g004610.m01.CDS01 n=1 Tax=Anthostomella pinea TaxID=933095 RepID=A0AAI8YIQ2_9PEZI|nr:Uu.00g004610.m01.CDS01 [Anthostomella pinea]
MAQGYRRGLPGATGDPHRQQALTDQYQEFSNNNQGSEATLGREEFHAFVDDTVNQLVHAIESRIESAVSLQVRRDNMIRHEVRLEARMANLQYIQSLAYGCILAAMISECTSQPAPSYFDTMEQRRQPRALSEATRLHLSRLRLIAAGQEPMPGSFTSDPYYSESDSEDAYDPEAHIGGVQAPTFEAYASGAEVQSHDRDYENHASAHAYRNLQVRTAHTSHDPTFDAHESYLDRFQAERALRRDIFFIEERMKLLQESMAFYQGLVKEHEANVERLRRSQELANDLDLNEFAPLTHSRLALDVRVDPQVVERVLDTILTLVLVLLMLVLVYLVFWILPAIYRWGQQKFGFCGGAGP